MIALLFRPEVITNHSTAGIKSAVRVLDLTNQQDWKVCEQMQTGRNQNDLPEDFISGREDISHQLDQEVLKALDMNEARP